MKYFPPVNTSNIRTTEISQCEALHFSSATRHDTDVLGVIGAAITEELSCESITSRLAIISGTSSCHMAVLY
jgi:hypothetical protein